MDDFNQIEEDLKKISQKENRKGEHKVSGKSVFKLQQIIQAKSKVPLKEGNVFRHADSKESVARDS